MKAGYRTVYEGCEAEITVKKSRFIASVRLVECEEEALSFLEEIRKKHWNASHNCFAYTMGEKREIVRASDDGEPSGTAGHPMLDVLLGEEMYNTAVVVTRYFGGTLLGTGGLVRAYSQAVQAGLSASTLIEKRYGKLLSLQTDYNGIGKIQHLLAQKKTAVMESNYTDVVELRILISFDEVEKLKAELIEAVNGNVKMEELEEMYYAVLDGAILTGEQLRKK